MIIPRLDETGLHRKGTLHQFRINRKTADIAVKGVKLPVKIRQNALRARGDAMAMNC